MTTNYKGNYIHKTEYEPYSIVKYGDFANETNKITNTISLIIVNIMFKTILIVVRTMT